MNAVPMGVEYSVLEPSDRRGRVAEFPGDRDPDRSDGEFRVDAGLEADFDDVAGVTDRQGPARPSGGNGRGRGVDDLRFEFRCPDGRRRIPCLYCCMSFLSFNV